MCPLHVCHTLLVFYCFTTLFFTHDGNQTKTHTDKLPIIIYCYVKCFSLLYQCSAWFMAQCALNNGIRHTFHFKFNENSLQVHSIVKCTPYSLITEPIIVMWLSEYNWNEMKWNGYHQHNCLTQLSTTHQKVLCTNDLNEVNRTYK